MIKRVYNHSAKVLNFEFIQNENDFIVDEIPLRFSNSGNFIILKVKKVNLDTWDLIETFAKYLNIYTNEIGYAGLKDKKATTTQYISIPKKYSKKIQTFRSNKIQILETILHNKKLNIGDLKGNRFRINIHNTSLEDLNHIQRRLKKISKESKIPIIAGTGSNSTNEAISLTKYAERIGANAALVVTPYFNKPTQEGLYQHFKSINDNCSIPIIIYNIPPRSVVDMSVDTMSRLFELKNIIGVKDATGDLNRVDQQRKKMGPDFIQLSGEDGTALEFNLQGGVGCISVTANVAPKLCSEFQEASTAKNNSNLLAKAKQINDKLMPLHKSLFIESSPSPVKYAASLLNLCSDDVRLPLVKITDETKKIVKSAMTHANLI